MRRLSGYPVWYYGFMLSILLGLFASALVILPNTMEMRFDMDTPFHVSSGIRLASTAAHSFLGFISIALLGSLTALHTRLGWQRRLNRLSGSVLIGGFALLLLSAIGIYYLGDPDLSRFTSLLHTIIGFAFAAIFIWHCIKGRKIRRTNPD